MPLAMSRPSKHPKSGVYWLRKGVPEDLRKLVGKREEKRSLRTRDPVEAKRRHAEALAEIETRWANLRAGPKVLTEREAHQLAVAVHDRWLQQHLENPSQQTVWNVDLADRLFAPPRKLKSYDILDPDFEASMDPESLQISRMEKWCFEIADERLAAHGLLVDETSRRVLAGAIAAALQRASLTLASLAKGGTPSSLALVQRHSHLLCRGRRSHSNNWWMAGPRSGGRSPRPNTSGRGWSANWKLFWATVMLCD
jgi:tRNA(Glu) U13 pseudouridine synthase TruD